MHAGSIFSRGDFNPYQLGSGVVMVEPDASDLEKLEVYVREFCSRFNKILPCQSEYLQFKRCRNHSCYSCTA
ncbi:MAG: hypothetical protein K8R34_03740 [Methanosarcinales archaeon]|nr:hypothetical protein [Methanosarcinales archaeon]